MTQVGTERGFKGPGGKVCGNQIAQSKGTGFSLSTAGKALREDPQQF